MQMRTHSQERPVPSLDTRCEDTFSALEMLRLNRAASLSKRAARLKGSLPIFRALSGELGRSAAASQFLSHAPTASTSFSSAASAPSASSPAGQSDAAKQAAVPPTHPSFDLVKVEFIKELSATAALYKHKKSGAELLSVICDEEEKVFGIAFKTPPANDAGVAHILEHSVSGRDTSRA